MRARRSCIHCCNWKNKSDNEILTAYPTPKCDYYFSFLCKEKNEAHKFLSNQLKKEGFSLSGWRLVEIPASHVYIFHNKKKCKEITVIYDEKVGYTINSTDSFWKYSEKYNVYQHETIAEAFKAPWQHWSNVIQK